MIAILAEVGAIACADMNSEFRHAFANWLRVAKIPLLDLP